MLPQDKFVSMVADAAGCTKKDIRVIMQEINNVVVGQLNDGKSVVLPGLPVKFELVEKPATKERKGRNPATGEPITIPPKPAHNVLKIKPMKKMREAVAS